jgi:hypothetical protein
VELQHLVGALTRRRTLILIPAVVGLLLAGVALHFFGTGGYRATASLLLDPTAITAPDQTPFAGDPERYVDGQLRLLKSSELASRAAEKLSGHSPDDILKAVELEHVTGSDVVDVSAVAATAPDARDMANALTAAYVEGRRAETAGTVATELANTRDQLARVRDALKDLPQVGADTEQSALLTQYEELTARELTLTSPGVTRDETTVLDAATLPGKRQSFPVGQGLLGGLILGGLLGLAVAALVESRNPHVGSVASLEQLLRSPVLAVQSTGRRFLPRPAGRRRPGSHSATQTIASVINAEMTSSTPRLVAVTAVSAAAPTSEMARDLVAALAQQGLTVAFITESAPNGERHQFAVANTASDSGPAREEDWRRVVLNLPASHQVAVLSLPPVLSGSATSAVLRMCNDLLLVVDVNNDRQHDVEVALRIMPPGLSPLVLARK